MSKHDTIKTFLSNELGLDVSAIENDTPLFTSGLIDSFSLIEMLSFLESEMDVKVDIADLSIDELDTIDGIVALVN